MPNTQRPTLLHTDTVELCGGSHKLLKLHHYGALALQVRITSSLLHVATHKTVWDNLSDIVFTINFYVLQSNATVHCGDLQRTYHVFNLFNLALGYLLETETVGQTNEIAQDRNSNNSRHTNSAVYSSVATRPLFPRGSLQAGHPLAVSSSVAAWLLFHWQIEPHAHTEAKVHSLT